MKARRRYDRGSMILLSVMVIGIVIVIIVLGVGVMFLFSSHRKAQGETDSIALEAASILNAHDRAGQMNNLVARCRELVFTSRETYDDAAQNYRHLEPLARQLLDESRQSAHLVEDERQRLTGQELSELKDLARSGDITSINVGYINGIPSNVAVAEGVPELLQRDRSAGYIEPRSGLYNGNINAKLPGIDQDLDFHISSLPAPVKGTIAPARLATSSAFKQTAQAYGHDAVGRCEQLPSAVQLQFKKKVTTGGADKQGAEVKLGVTAVSNGAQPAP